MAYTPWGGLGDLRVFLLLGFSLLVAGSPVWDGLRDVHVLLLLGSWDSSLAIDFRALQLLGLASAVASVTLELFTCLAPPPM